MFDDARKDLDHLVYGHEIPAGLVDPVIVAAAKPFEVIPDAASIGADHEVAAVCSRDLRKSALRDAVLGQIG